MDITRLLPALILAFCATVSQADTLKQTFEFHVPGEAYAAMWGEGYIDPYFDPALGTLTRVDASALATTELQGVFLDTCTRDPGGSGICAINGEFFVRLVDTLWLTALNENLSGDIPWEFYPETEDPLLLIWTYSEAVYPESYYSTFYTLGDSARIEWLSRFVDTYPGESVEYFFGRGQVDIELTFTYTYDPIDADGDGVPDIWDAYPNISLGGRLDTDGDGIPNDCDAACIALGMAADLDDDDDGVPDVDDAYPEISLDGRLDTDNDGIPNDCSGVCISLGMLADLDDDADEWADSVDNCRLISNNAQLDSNEDGCGDACNVVLPGCGLVACVND
jgi:hypothetical protein